MFDEIDRAYFERRAREERERADRTTDAIAARTHIRLADDFQQQADRLKPMVAAA